MIIDSDDLDIRAAELANRAAELAAESGRWANPSAGDDEGQGTSADAPRDLAAVLERLNDLVNDAHAFMKVLRRSIERSLLDTRAAAKLLGLSQAEVRRQMASGGIDSVRVRRSVRIRRFTVMQILARRAKESGTAS